MPCRHPLFPFASVIVGVLLLSAACTRSSDGPSSSDGAVDGSDGGTAESLLAEETTTTTAAPLILGLAEDLGLLPAQCFDAVPEPPTTEPPPSTTTTTVAGAESTTTVAPTTTDPPPPTTTIPKPPTIAIVDCRGTHAGAAFAAMCVGSLIEANEIIDQPNELGQVGCPGDAALEWPGDRLLRRAAARACLVIFEQAFGEPYSESEVTTSELVPTRSVWERGDRRIVCTADRLAP